ncbi:phage tail protein [Azospirillum lipoferum]|uniref:Phage tail collar domain-containing protein n=1 Tax=Azospirillum lipoferum (strain 4B) TaxID=862719 RepID=G7Z300_AZOL4|nr:tail fiber protein [Azospirillum lipoferum]CBS87788.1 conserved protein of unknown function; phage tail collar domain [Azospirillum lipoferum 4B]
MTTCSCLVPTGALLAFGGAIAPAGYLLCDGSAVDRTTYSDLFAVLGTSFGAGDGATSFNLPDLRGRVPAGKDDMGGTAANRLTSTGSNIAGTTLGASGGAETHTLTTAQMPNHYHSVYPHAGYVLPSSGTRGAGSEDPYATSNVSSSATSSVGGGQQHNNTQPSLITTYIIKA